MSIQRKESADFSQVLPVFDLAKFWEAYMALLSNPVAAMGNPMKAWNGE